MSLENIIGKLPTPPPPKGPFNSGTFLAGGVGFVFLGWWMSGKATLKAIFGVLDAAVEGTGILRTLAQMNDEQFAGIGLNVASFLIASAVLAMLVVRLIILVIRRLRGRDS